MTSRFLMMAGIALVAGVMSGCAMMPGAKTAEAVPVACGARDINVYFEEQSTELSADARSVIDAMTTGLAGCKIDHVRIVGASDAAEAEQVSEEISHERTRVLKDYLVDHTGWPRDSMELLARGERSATTESGLAVPMRRRARIVVTASAPL